MADAFDAHICLACRTLVTGLENYVAHIKECRVRPKTSVQNPSVVASDLDTSAASNLDFSTIQNLLQNLDSENGSVQERHESTAATSQVHTNGVHNNMEYFVSEKHRGEDVSNFDEDVEQNGSDGLSLTNVDNLNSIPKSWQKPDSLSMSPSKATTAAYNANDDTTGDCGFEDFISFLGLQTSNNKTADDMDFMASKRDLDAINADLKKGMRIAQLLSQWDLSSSSEEEDEDAEGHSASPAQAPKYDKRPRKLPTGAKWKPGMLQKKGKATTAANSEVTLQTKSPEQEKTSLTSASSLSHYSLRQNRNPSEKGLEVVLSKLRRKVDAIAAEAARDESSQSEAPEVVNSNSADDVEEVEESEYHEYECKPCKLKFQSLARKNQHYRSQRHRACVEKGGNDKDAAAPVHAKGERSKLDLKCPTCDKTFGNKQSFVKHLLSIYHKRRMRGEESGQVEQAEIAKALLSLRPYQCRVCAYYVTDRQEFFDHIKSDGHSEAVGKLVGSLWCRQCKCVCSDVEDLVAHFDAFEHSTEQPWCVKEKRFHVTCKVCGKEEHSANRLQYHMQVHHSSDKTNNRRKPKRPIRASKSLTCRKCDRTLSSAMSLENHMKRKHASDEDKPFACQFCASAFIDAQSLKSHEKSEKHLNRMVELGGNQMSKLLPAAKPSQVDCVFCAFKAQMPIELRDHYRSSHANMIMDCVSCGIVCVTTTQWEKHVKMGRHRKRVEYYERHLAGHGTMQSCDECGQCFYTNLEFRMHQMSHHTILSESLMAKKLGGGTFYGINARYHNYLRQQPKGNTIRIACPSCGKMLQRQYLLPHLRAHSGSQPFVCVQCQATFSNSMSLRRHIKMLHVARTSIICEHCGRAFNNRMKLALHKIRTHKDQTTERSYKCDKCDRVFVQPCQLKCHALIHGEKTFQCTFPGCQRAFRSKGELVVHLRVHNDERPFLCEQCSYAARTRQQLVRHQRTHTGERRYNCEYCDYKATNSTHIRRHQRVHIGSKPFKCPYCDYCCTSLENIRKHILKTKKHAGLPCYPCNRCTFGTNDANILRDHAIEAHGATEQELYVSSLYSKVDDLSKLPEGSLVLQPKERRSRKCESVNSLGSADSSETLPNKPKSRSKKRSTSAVSMTAAGDGGEASGTPMIKRTKRLAKPQDIVAAAYLPVADANMMTSMHHAVSVPIPAAPLYEKQQVMTAPTALPVSIYGVHQGHQQASHYISQGTYALYSTAGTSAEHLQLLYGGTPLYADR